MSLQIWCRIKKYKTYNYITIEKQLNKYFYIIYIKQRLHSFVESQYAQCLVEEHETYRKNIKQKQEDHETNHVVNVLLESNND